MQQTDTYKPPITIKFPNMVARVYSPMLDLEERERRLKKIHRASANILKGAKSNEKGSQISTAKLVCNRNGFVGNSHNHNGLQMVSPARDSGTERH